MRRVSARPVIALLVLIGGVLSPPLLWGAALSAADSAFLQQLDVSRQKSERLLDELRIYIDQVVDPYFWVFEHEYLVTRTGWAAGNDAVRLSVHWDSVHVMAERCGSSMRELWTLQVKMIDQLDIAAKNLFDAAKYGDTNASKKIRPALLAAEGYQEMIRVLLNEESE